MERKPAGRAHLWTALATSVLWCAVTEAAPRPKATKTAAPASAAVVEPEPAPTVAPVPAAAVPAPVVESPPAPKSTGDDERIAIAVMEVTTSPNIPPELGAALADVVPQELDDLGAFRAITRGDIVQMVKYEQVKQLLGCDEAACLTELGGALGADYVASGSVSRLGDACVLQFRLIKMSASRVVQRVSRQYRGDLSGLLGEMRDVTRLLVRDLMVTQVGTLRLAISEEGATVKVDGSILGVSPVEDLSIASGIHSLTVEKQSFVVHTRDVQVQKAGVTALTVTLVPSEEFRQQYVASAQKARLVAWSVTGAGVLALGGAAGLYALSRSEAELLRTDVAAFNADPAGRTKEREAELSGRRRRVGISETSTVVSAGVGVAALVTGLVLLVTADDPHHFDAVPAAAPAVSVGVLPGAAFAQVHF